MNETYRSLAPISLSWLQLVNDGSQPSAVNRCCVSITNEGFISKLNPSIVATRIPKDGVQELRKFRSQGLTDIQFLVLKNIKLLFQFLKNKIYCSLVIYSIQFTSCVNLHCYFVIDLRCCQLALLVCHYLHWC